MVTSVNEVSNAIQDVASGATSQAQDLMDVVKWYQILLKN